MTRLPERKLFWHSKYELISDPLPIVLYNLLLSATVLYMFCVAVSLGFHSTTAGRLPAEHNGVGIISVVGVFLNDFLNINCG